ncbi:MFS transporter [Streptomyces sp. HUAS TT20]|uniref:MFS transporter n=1 Tax=Streptomyces sp. HUAS TT20 TaxID=3447509 RepID=UPI0021DA01FA|nr:MFS transporter [Streptomyces sp. HUAS 15-9]UXY30470.1 MFS transporter [Streptomyces sp. HUAS 15-9]
MEKTDKGLTLRFITLAIGMFAIGTDSFVVAGILPSVGKDLDVSVPTSAELITAYALSYAILSPVVAAVAARVPRRVLLISGLLVFIAGNIGTGLAPSFEVAMGFRVMAALGGAMFTPTAAGVVVALAGPERRGTALSILFGGLSAATALGSPIGTAISGFTDWRGTMVFVAAVGVVAAIAISVALPSVPSPPAVTLKQRLSPVTDARIALTLLLVLVGYSGLFILYTYVSQVFAPATDGNGRTLAWLLFAWGIAAVVGNMTSGRLTDKLGNRVVINTAGVIAVAVFATTPWTSRHLVTAFVAVMLWGACGWAMLVPIQHRLAGVNPAVAQMSISLSSSANYVGVSLAPVVGRFLLDHDVDMRYLGVPSAAIVVVGLLIGETGYLLIRRQLRQAEADSGAAPAEDRAVTAR